MNEPPAIVVTGSTGGIGRACALRLASSGAHVMVHGFRNVEAGTELVQQVEAAGGVARFVAADISQSAGRQQLLEAVAHWRSRITAWVHCAGVDVLTGSLASQSFETKLQRLWETDVCGTIVLARDAAQRMREALVENASMVFLGWDQASEGMEGDAGQMFGPIKAAVTSFAANLAQELAPQIRVNTVAPGWIRTAWGEETDSYWDQRARASALLGRWGTPEDVAEAVAFLVSPQAGFVTGQTINVNGGWNRRGQSKDRTGSFGGSER